MFNVLTSAVKAASAAVEAPVALAADAVTLGGALTDREESYTESMAEKFVQNVADMTDPEK